MALARALLREPGDGPLHGGHDPVQLLAALDDPGWLLGASADELVRQLGVSALAASQIEAALALARRALVLPMRGYLCRRPDEVVARFAGRTLGLRHERVWVLGLDGRNRCIGEDEVARGGAAEVSVHPREVFRPLIRQAALAGVVVHNHPSGDPEPSEDDLELTARLRAAGHLLGIPIVDHLIVAGSHFVSLASRGWPEPSGLPVP